MIHGLDPAVRNDPLEVTFVVDEPARGDWIRRRKDSCKCMLNLHICHCSERRTWSISAGAVHNEFDQLPRKLTDKIIM